MKNLFALLLIGATCLCSTLANAGTITLAGSPFVFTGNTNSSSVGLTSASAQVQSQYVSVQVVTNFTSTNDVIFSGQVSLDNSNWVTISTFQCPATNAASYPWATVLTNMTVYGRIAIQGTNTARAIFLQLNN